jgi:hypothetical protein
MSERTTLEAIWRPHGDEKPRIFDDDLQVITRWMANKEGQRRSDGIAIAERNLVLVQGLSNPLLYHRPRSSHFLLPSVIHDLEKAGALVFTALDKVDRASVGEAINGINTAWKSFVYPLAAMNRNKLVDSGAGGRKLTEMTKRRAVDERLLALARAKERCIRYRESRT